jgi:hypothetical protein
MEYFKELAKLVNMQEIVKKGRPKKLVLDNVSKTIEEIFTLRFYRESEILRAVTNNKQKEIQNESFTEFVYSCLKEKYKTKSLREQVTVNYHKVSYRMDLRSFSVYICTATSTQKSKFLRGILL